MNRTTRKFLIPGLGLGAAAAYLLDPSRGRRRRALLRDQANHLAHVSMDASGKAGRDLKNRTVGAVHDLRAARSDEGSREKLGQQIDVTQENWSPATRCGTCGGAGQVQRIVRTFEIDERRRNAVQRCAGHQTDHTHIRLLGWKARAARLHRLRLPPG